MSLSSLALQFLFEEVDFEAKIVTLGSFSMVPSTVKGGVGLDFLAAKVATVEECCWSDGYG